MRSVIQLSGRLKKNTGMVISKETVQNVAHILGPFSAAAQALHAGENYTNPLFVKAGEILLVLDNPTLPEGMTAEKMVGEIILLDK
jgi:hypothetical protein